MTARRPKRSSSAPSAHAALRHLPSCRCRSFTRQDRFAATVLMSACRPSSSRAFRHTSIYVRKDRINWPQDLKGRKHRCRRVPAHGQCVGARAAGRRPGRRSRRCDLGARRARGNGPAGEGRGSTLPASLRARGRAGRRDICRACWRGRYRRRDLAARALVPRTARPACRLAVRRSGRGRAKDYYRRTRLFPIMHLVGIKRCSWPSAIPGCRRPCSRPSLQSKDAALKHLGDTAATKVTLPFVEEQLKRRAGADGRLISGRTDSRPTGTCSRPSSRHHHDAGPVAQAGARRGAVPCLDA